LKIENFAYAGWLLGLLVCWGACYLLKFYLFVVVASLLGLV
jgi:hypothetical protein